jgi:hypothetical protein
MLHQDVPFRDVAYLFDLAEIINTALYGGPLRKSEPVLERLKASTSGEWAILNPSDFEGAPFGAPPNDQVAFALDARRKKLEEVLALCLTRGSGKRTTLALGHSLSFNASFAALGSGAVAKFSGSGPPPPCVDAERVPNRLHYDRKFSIPLTNSRSAPLPARGAETSAPSPAEGELRRAEALLDQPGLDEGEIRSRARRVLALLAWGPGEAR